MNQIDEQWLTAKREELRKAKLMFGAAIRMWDTPRFIVIIDEKDREIRRLKTQLAAKASA